MNVIHTNHFNKNEAADEPIAGFQAYFSKANILKNQGRLNEAVACFQRAIELKPDFTEAYYNLANTLLTNGETEAAIDAYGRVLGLDPHHAPALNNLGVALKASGDIERAIFNYEQAIWLKPDFAEAYKNLANAFCSQGRFDDAIEKFEIVLELTPNFTDTYFSLGRLYSETNRAEDAIGCYQKLLQIQPHNGKALINLGNAFYGQRKLHEAIACYQKALQLNPENAEAAYNMANALLAQDRLEQALDLFQTALALKPNWAELSNNMGTAFQRKGQLSNARNCFKRALDIQPDYAEAMNNLGIVFRNQGEIKAAIGCYRTALETDPTYSEAHSNLLFCLNYDSAVTQKDAFVEACNWWHRHGLAGANAFVHLNTNAPCRRLRIGYVSPDFRWHSVGFFFLPLIAAHNHDDFEIFCYSEVKQPDQFTHQIKAHADHWYSTVGRTNAAVAERIYSDQIDILVDLAGHTANNRLGVFTSKPAPIQITWLGYPNTTGLTTIDYRLTDSIADPPEATDHLYSESLVRLPQGFLCYGPPENAPAVSVPPAKETGRITFGSFNALPKMNAEVIAVWSEILRQVSGSSLLLKCKQLADKPTQKNYLEEFTRNGISPDQVRMIAHTPSFREHLAWYNKIDIGLDPFPYNGTTTTCEALWMGVPVISLQGERHSARVGASILSNIGLTELIARTPKAYIRKAIELALNCDRLQELRSGMRSRIASSPLTDAEGFARGMESVYDQVWWEWCRKRVKKMNTKHRMQEDGDEDLR